MSTQALKQAATGGQEDRAKAKDFPGMLEMYKKQIALALPKHMDADRMARIALTSFRMQPLLAKCDPASVFACVIQASQLGLEPGINGEAYLVPFWHTKKSRYECQLIPGYRGLIKLARNTSQIESVSAHIVFERDEGELVLGSEERLTHKPCLAGDRGRPLWGYCIARFKDGGQHIEPMTWTDIMAIKERSKSRDKSGKLVGPWVTDEHEMARKTIVRRASKYWPMSIELATAVALDQAAAMGVAQELDASRILQGEAYVVPDDQDDASASSSGAVRGTTADPKGDSGYTLAEVIAIVNDATDDDGIAYARSLLSSLSEADAEKAREAIDQRAADLTDK